MSVDGDHIYAHGTDVHLVKGCIADDGLDLLAVSGSHSVVVLSYTHSSCDVVATFYLGIGATALAWSPRTTSPLAGSEFHIELIAAVSDGELRHLYKSHESTETIINIKSDSIVPLKGPIRDLVFCGDVSRGSGGRYLASILDDKKLVIWDIFPESGRQENREASMESNSGSSLPTGVAETWTVSFRKSLRSVAIHPDASKYILVGDNCGTVYLVELEMCRSLTHTSEAQVVMEFIDPHSLAKLAFSPVPSFTGFVSWKGDEANTIAAAFRDRWVIWEQTNGSRPVSSGTAFYGEGAHRLRWCPTDTRLFALSPVSRMRGAVLHIHNVGFVNSAPTVFEIAGKPHFIRDFDWLGATNKDSPLVAVAVGRLVHILRLAE